MLNTKQLAELVDRKHAVLTQLRELAQRQLQLAEQSETSAIIGLMAVKQRLLDALVKIEDDLNPFRSEDPDGRDWPSPDERTRCAVASQQCQALLEEVMDLDRRGMELLRERQQQNKQHIDAAHQSAAARTAYIASEQITAARIDIASD